MKNNHKRIRNDEEIMTKGKNNHKRKRNEMK